MPHCRASNSHPILKHLQMMPVRLILHSTVFGLYWVFRYTHPLFVPDFLFSLLFPVHDGSLHDCTFDHEVEDRIWREKVLKYRIILVDKFICLFRAERRSLQEQYEKVVSQLKNSRMDVQRREVKILIVFVTETILLKYFPPTKC